MNQAQTHLLILWSAALDYKDVVLGDLEKSFRIIRVFRCHWDEDKFLSSLRKFYSHSQFHLGREQYDALLRGKMAHCGTGDFLAVVFEDPSPDYNLRSTSTGERMVNVNTFDRKTRYRAMTGGGYRVHTSDDAFETNKDLTLLFGLNAKDFRTHYTGYSSEEECFNGACLGVGGYGSIEQLMYVLNNSIKYCVLRNYSCLPDKYTVSGHGDIDLLVENRNYAIYLTGARQVFPEPYRVYQIIKIAGEDVPFDFRYVGDDYYDPAWESDILKTRILEHGLFYVPNQENHFYSLLYHAYVQKCEVSDDYISTLSALASGHGLSYDPDPRRVVHVLDSFLQQNGYEYTEPQDRSVVYNRDFLSFSNYALRYGEYVKRTDSEGENGYVYSCIVYRDKTSVTKKGTAWLIDNEARMLSLVEGDSLFFPRVISVSNVDEPAIMGDKILKMSRMPGVHADVFFKNPSHQRRKFIKSFVHNLDRIVRNLEDSGIVHRDIQPSNVIVCDLNGKCGVSLIDFGWACLANELGGAPSPTFLNREYRASGTFSDRYSAGKIVEYFWPELRYARRVSSRMCTGKDSRHVPFTLVDEARLFIRRHLRVKQYLKQLFR